MVAENLIRLADHIAERDLRNARQKQGNKNVEVVYRWGLWMDELFLRWVSVCL